MEESNPTWKEGVKKLSYPKLSENLACDVVIIGGGLAGVLTAYLLAKENRKVIVLEKDKIGSGTTEYTTAFITQALDTDVAGLVQLFGEEKTKLIWQSGADAIDLIERIVDQEKIECDFTRTKVIVYANSEKEYEQLQTNYKAESELGFGVIAPVRNDKFKFINYGYYEIPNQAKFHPLKFLYGLVERAEKLGVKFYEDSEVEKIKHSEAFVKAETSHHHVHAEFVAVTTYQPFHNRIRLFLKRGMYRSFVLEARLPKGLIAEGLYWDLDNPYHYFRIDKQENYDRMILGGEDIKTIFKVSPEKTFKALDEYLQQILAGQEFEITKHWSGPILEPSDGLALIGQTYERELVATAFSGNGMTYSAISGLILTDKIMGRSNVYAHIYDPKRIPTIKQLFIKGKDYVEEFFGGAAKNVLKKKSESST